MENKHQISIIPNSSLWMKLGRTKYTIPKALSELIDNSIDNRVNDNVNVDIFFAIDGDYIGILDDAKGMNVDSLAKALTIAEHQDDITDTIGEHGFGLESATSYLGKKLTIYTKTEDMDDVLKFTYDEEEFLKKNEWTVDYHYISKEDMEKETDLNFEHGTYILVEKLNVRLYYGLVTSKDGKADGSMVSKFQSIYKKYIENNILNLNIFVEKKRTSFNQIEITAPLKQNLAFKLDFSFVLRNGDKDLKIKGWAGILDFYNENTRNKKKYTSGFDVISKNKVILQHVHLGYSYHPEKRLLLGEIELENFRTTSDKTDFIRNSDWQALELALNYYIIKPTLYLGSTAYLNSLCKLVKDNKEFDINKDFFEAQNRFITDETLRDFKSELNPVTIENKSIVVNESIFESCYEEIVQYMREKNELDDFSDEILEDISIVEEVSSFDEIIEEKNIQEFLSVEDTDENNGTDENASCEEGDYKQYLKCFKYKGMKVGHVVSDENDNLNYDTMFDKNNNTLGIKSYNSENSNMFASRESYYKNNIYNALLDYELLKLNKCKNITKETIQKIREDINQAMLLI